MLDQEAIALLGVDDTARTRGGIKEHHFTALRLKVPGGDESRGTRTDHRNEAGADDRAAGRGTRDLRLSWDGRSPHGASGVRREPT